MFERLTGGWRFINLQNVGEINYRSHKFAIWLFWQCIFDSRSFQKCTHFLGTNSLIPCSQGIPWTHYTVHTKKIAQYGKVYSKNVARLLVQRLKLWSLSRDFSYESNLIFSKKEISNLGLFNVTKNDRKKF
jgi:hypothetical protein